MMNEEEKKCLDWGEIPETSMSVEEDDDKLEKLRIKMYSLKLIRPTNSYQFSPLVHPGLYSPASYFRESCINSEMPPPTPTPTTFSYDTVTVNSWIAAKICSLPPNCWKAFRDSSKADYHSGDFSLAIQFSATVLYLLFPKEIPYLAVFNTKLIPQLNDLWENVAALGRKGNALEEAFKLVTSLTSATEKYSLVTETEVSRMMDMYSFHVWYCTFTSPYRCDPSSKPIKYDPEPEERNSSKVQLFQEILKVVEKMEFPREMQVNQYTRLLIKIMKRDLDNEWLLILIMDMVNNEIMHSRNPGLTFPYLGSRGSEFLPFHARLKSAFNCLLNNIISEVYGTINMKLVEAVLPLRRLYTRDDLHLVSWEIKDLIYVAEIRRIAFGSRFITNEHLFWAFHELGYGSLPYRINIDQLPYLIYLNSKNLADYCGDKIRLENFLFTLLFYSDVADSPDEKKMIQIEEHYKKFLTGMRSMSIGPSNREGPIFVIEDLSEKLQGIHVELKI